MHHEEVVSLTFVNWNQIGEWLSRVNDVRQAPRVGSFRIPADNPAGFVYYFNPSFFPAASSAIDSRMRLSRVSSRLAV